MLETPPPPTQNYLKIRKIPSTKKKDFEHLPFPKYCNLSKYNEVKQSSQNLKNLLLLRFLPCSSYVQVFYSDKIKQITAFQNI